MFMSIVSHLLSAWFAFLLPCFGTWKALSHRPLSEPEIERWGMYWTVIGAFVTLEYVAEWLGSTWVYQTYLHPFFSKNEEEIQAGIVSAQSNALTFLQTSFGKLYDAVMRIITKTPPAQAPPSPGAPAQPPAASPFAFAKGLWDTYGPAAVGAVQRYTQSAQPAQAASAPSQAPQTSATTTGYDAAPARSQPGTPAQSPPATDGAPAFPEPKLY
ncbi:unnamed protein product [Somion occarium]|uniref:Protein YOP1 n=1 Tax=Somion occarium TaxID=3059160 RepID=A0ABP1CK22_9APHY